MFIGCKVSMARGGAQLLRRWVDNARASSVLVRSECSDEA